MRKYLLLTALIAMPFTEVYATATINYTIGWLREDPGGVWYQGAVDLKNIKTGKTTTLVPMQAQADPPNPGKISLVAGEYEITAGYYKYSYPEYPRGNKFPDYPDSSCQLARPLKKSFEEGKSYEINLYLLNGHEYCDVKEIPTKKAR